jgi:hypothetical protein
MIAESAGNLADGEIPINPFPGIRPFEFHESHLFFGRDGQSGQLISKLSRSRFLAVVGTSASGKSSLVRAGLLPALLGGFMPGASSAWRVALMRPGNDPIGNLAHALNTPSSLSERTIRQWSEWLMGQALVAHSESSCSFWPALYIPSLVLQTSNQRKHRSVG